jgi:hypothetical protein
MADETLVGLIERLEAATAQDHELDADIALTQGWHELPGDNWIGPHAEICVPAYTASPEARATCITVLRARLNDDPTPAGDRR